MKAAKKKSEPAVLNRNFGKTCKKKYRFCMSKN